MKVVLSPHGVAGEVAFRLRDMAAEVEAETELDVQTETVVVLRLLENEHLEINAFGRNADRVRAMGMMHEAMKSL